MDLPGKRCVLVVDDDAGIRQLLKTFLRCRGFTLSTAGNGREALEAMRAGHTDVVVMDLMMPEVSGWDVLSERVADPSLRQIPMIVITALNIRDVTQALLDKYVCTVLGKPFDLDALLAAVTACVDPPAIDAPVAA